MYEYDPMKDNASSNDQGASSPKGASDRAYSFEETNARDGRGYTNPDGSHGYIYNSAARGGGSNRTYRGAMIALSAVLVTAVLGTCCFFGAYMAARSLGGDEEEGSSESAYEAGTSGGLTISGDGTSSDEGAVHFPTETYGEGDASDPSGDQTHLGVETIPPTASIEKLPAERVDANGDGRAEIETDERGEVLTSAGRDTVSVATVVSRVAASVVEITTETIVQSGHIGQYITSGAGSGVIISREGFIVTNHHVIDGASTITVRLNDGREYPATLIGSDERTDVAVLWIDASDTTLTVATLGASFDLVVGEDILAIGNPLGSLGGTVTEGMISATAREISVGGTNMTLLQVSAPINPGNSGGGLFNLAGELVGVVNAKMSSEEIEGLGFAIPIDTAYTIILELIDHGYVRGRPTLDFSVADVTSVQTAMRYFGSFNTGLYVYDEHHDTVKYGDLILSADGKEITGSADLSAVVNKKSVGDTIELTLLRDRREITVTVTVVEDIPESSGTKS